MPQVTFEKMIAFKEVEKIFNSLKGFLELNNFIVEEIRFGNRISIYKNDKHKLYDTEVKINNLVLRTDHIDELLSFCKGINAENGNNTDLIKDLELPKILFS